MTVSSKISDSVFVSESTFPVTGFLFSSGGRVSSFSIAFKNNKPISSPINTAITDVIIMLRLLFEYLFNGRGPAFLFGFFAFREVMDGEFLYSNWEAFSLAAAVSFFASFQ